MAILYSYPKNTNILATDIIVGSSTIIFNGRPKNQTKSFEIQNLATFINAGNTLDTVLQNGNTSLLDAKIGELYLYDGVNGDYAKISIQDDLFLVSRATSGTAIFSVDDGSDLSLNNGIGQANIFNNLTTTRNYTLPDASGTFALTSDLLSYVPYTGATQAVNLGAFDLTVNSISIGKGTGTNTTSTRAGEEALQINSTGVQNTAFGYRTLKFNTTGSYNTAIGSSALAGNTTGANNTAIGRATLGANTIGINNIGIGINALFSNSTTSYNIGIGVQALSGPGNSNTIGIGYNAGTNSSIGSNTNSSNSIFIGDETKPPGNVETNQIVIGYQAIGAGSNTVTLGNTSITTTRLRGAVQGGSFVKDGGTAIQYLMADGSISTNGTLYSVVSTTYQTVAGALQSISSAIPSNIFTSGNLLKLNTVITTTAATVAIATIEFYINSAATTVGATLIGRYNGPIGNQYIPMDRFFWVSGTTIYGRDFTASASTSTSNSIFAINSAAIPATQFYIIAQVTTTSTDRAAISLFQIEKS